MTAQKKIETWGGAAAALIVIFSPMLGATRSVIISGIALAGYLVLLYQYDREYLRSHRGKFVSAFLIAFVIAFVVLANARRLSGEDNWLCRNGEWVKHGNPSAPMPTEPCVK